MKSTDHQAALNFVDLEAPTPETTSKARVLSELSKDAQVEANKYLRDTEVPEGGE
jgi:hypothetical protein